MENKFILIEEYPGSPKSGTVIEPKTCLEVSNTNNYYWEGSWFNPRKYPKNWKEFIQPDFQVLSIISPDGYTAKGKEIIYGYAYGAFPGYKIHSVKRVSDGEVFTVGDSISMSFKTKKITEIFLSSKGNAFKGGVWARYQGGACHIDRLQKVKSPLFKTEDGLDVFEGDIIYHVCSLDNSYKLSETKARKEIKEVPIYFHYFLKKEKAEEYIKMNKKEFSRAQVIELLNTVATTKELTINFNVVNNGIN